MFKPKNFLLLILCAAIITAVAAVSGSVVLGSNTEAVQYRTASYSLPNESTAHIVFDLEPTPTELAPVETPAPAPDGSTGTDSPGGVYSFLQMLLAIVVSGAISGALVLISVLAVVSKIKNDVNMQNVLERAIDWLAQSTPAGDVLKPTLNKLGVEMTDAGGVLTTITDGQPNEPK